MRGRRRGECCGGEDDVWRELKGVAAMVMAVARV